MRSWNTSGKHWSGVNTPGGPYKRFKINTYTATGRRVVPTITTWKTQNKTLTDQATALKKGPPREKANTGHIVIPYIQGLGNSIKKICGKYGIQTHFKGNRTLKQLLVNQRIRTPWTKRVESFTATSVGEVACNEEYIGETGRTLGERYRELLKEPSPIHVHIWQTGHNATPDQREGGPGPNQDHKGICLHQGKQSHT